MAVFAPSEIVLLLVSMLVIFGLPLALTVWLWRWQCSRYGDPSDPYNETGGFRDGETLLRTWNYSWPLARLRASAEEIRIDICFPWERTYRFRRREIRELSRFRGFSPGLRIEHVGADHPPVVVFWTWRFSTLKKGLERFGYFVLE